MIPCKRASSATSLTEDCKFSGKSFTYNKTNNGPRTVPCGTPDDTMMGLGRLPSQITDWVRPVRNDSNHLSKFSRRYHSTRVYDGNAGAVTCEKLY